MRMLNGASVIVEVAAYVAARAWARPIATEVSATKVATCAARSAPEAAGGPVEGGPGPGAREVVEGGPWARTRGAVASHRTAARWQRPATWGRAGNVN